MSRTGVPSRARASRRSGFLGRRGAWLLLGALLLLGGARTVASAQGTTLPEGASELLLPTGARTMGLGQATAALENGGESLWWNPAGLARLARPEAAVHHAQAIGFTGDLLTFALPRQPFGVFTVAANLIDYGAQEFTDEAGVVGTFQMRSTVFAAGYATAFGRHVNAGLAYKVLRVHFGSSVAGTSAVDLGVQARHGLGGGELSAGVALRNVGLRLQYKDEQQADPLPTRLDLGVAFVRPLETLAPGLAAMASFDAVTGPRTATVGLRAGGEVSWQGKYFARAGYARAAPGASGPSLGVGLESGRFILDITRVFDAVSTQNGTPPNFFSLRVRF